MVVFGNLCAINGSTESRTHKVLGKAEKSLSCLLSPRVGVTKGGDERRVLARGVELGVHGSLWEDGHLVLLQLGRDYSGFVLGGHLRIDGAIDDEIKFCGARMRVGRVEAAGPEETHCHGGILPHERGKGQLAATHD